MIPLFSVDQIRNADNYAIEKLSIPGIVLMENASINIFNSIIKNYPQINSFDTIGIICGKGNNGGDGFAIARHFINNGYRVVVIAVAESIKYSGDALINYNILKKLIKANPLSEIKVYKSKSDLAKLKQCSVIIDALLGTGTKGEITGIFSELIEYSNSLDSIKIAVDIPSGLNPENSSGEIIFDADLTITLAELKTSLFYNKGYSYSGKIEKGYIGIGEEYFDNQKVQEYLIEPEDAFNYLPQRKLDDHKYSSGKCLVIAGSGNMPGAAVVATNSLFKVGTGSGLLAFPKSIKTLAQNKIDVGIVHSYEDENSEILQTKNVNEITEKIKWADCLVLGPGLGREQETLDAVKEIVIKNSSSKMIIDADAIIALRGIKNLNLKNKVLTPHYGEFAALLDVDKNVLKDNLLKFGKEFVKKTNAILVLKGAPAIIFLPSGEVLINTTGNPGMAKFGSGDVLSGILGGIVSQYDNLEGAVIAGVYLHSLCADLLLKDKTVLGFTAIDLIENIPSTIKFLYDSFAE